MACYGYPDCSGYGTSSQYGVQEVYPGCSTGGWCTRVVWTLQWYPASKDPVGQSSSQNLIINQAPSHLRASLAPPHLRASLARLISVLRLLGPLVSEHIGLSVFY